MTDLYRFSFKVISSDPTGYYYDDWSKHIPTAVIAQDRNEAFAKVTAVHGTPHSGKRWKAKLLSVEPYLPETETIHG